ATPAVQLVSALDEVVVIGRVDEREIELDDRTVRGRSANRVVADAPVAAHPIVEVRDGAALEAQVLGQQPEVRAARALLALVEAQVLAKTCEEFIPVRQPETRRKPGAGEQDRAAFDDLLRERRDGAPGSARDGTGGRAFSCAVRSLDVTVCHAAEAPARPWAAPRSRPR